MSKIALLCLASALPVAAQAQAPPPEPAIADTPPQIWALHGQATFEDQYHPAFTSPFKGANSLDPGSRGDETFDLTLYAGLRPWSGGELWVNPEVDQGFGLSNTLGIAAFPSAEAYKVGASIPYVRVPRLFFRQTVDLGGAQKRVNPDLNVLGGAQTANRLVWWIGKFGVPDVFDTNIYANNPRMDFSNWALVNTGSFDYAADAWGFSYGTALEWYQDWWTLRAGGFALSRVPNSAQLDTSGSQFQAIAEAEERHMIWGEQGKLRVTGFLTRGRMGSYSDALVLAEQTSTTPSTASVRQYRSRSGVSLNLEQAITGDVGVFVRTGFAEGGREAYEFTDVDRTVSTGLSLRGARWGLPDDTVGLSTVIDGISRRHKAYLEAGGLGILVGDGRLRSSGPEQVVETYYTHALANFAYVTADYQFVNNPAYDRARGPVSILGVRLHLQY